MRKDPKEIHIVVRPQAVYPGTMCDAGCTNRATKDYEVVSKECTQLARFIVCESCWTKIKTTLNLQP